jgi:addiction module RelE/StbE family toxin
MKRKNKTTPDIKFSGSFDKQLRKAPDDIIVAFLDMLELFLEDPIHPSLRNHALREKFAGHWSIDVTADWRALYRKERNRIIFVELGTHNQLYG